jgi:RNase P subunit RPR2
MGRAWRHRRCPKCEIIWEAGALEVMGDYAEGWKEGKMARRCPGCGWVGETREFEVVRDPKPWLVGRAPVKLPPIVHPTCKRCGREMSVARVSEYCGGFTAMACG